MGGVILEVDTMTNKLRLEVVRGEAAEVGLGVARQMDEVVVAGEHEIEDASIEERVAGSDASAAFCNFARSANLDPKLPYLQQLSSAHASF